MQKQINNAQTTSVHVKVALDNEFRRFLLDPPAYEHLHSTLKNLFNLPSDFRIKFQDDENDWVLLTTDTELSYAIELSGSPLRLQVKILTEDAPIPAPSSEIEHKRWGRGGCRGGRGRGGKEGREGCKISPEERLSFKSSRLTARISVLEAKLTSEKLPSERERVLRWKITKLQEKLATVEAMKESFGSSNPTVPEPAVTSEPGSEEPVTPMGEEKPWSCRGGHRGRGRGGHPGRFREEGDHHPCHKKGHKKGWKKALKAKMDPTILENFRECKAKLHAARESGDETAIKAAREAFFAAKEAKWSAIASIKAEKDDCSV